MDSYLYKRTLDTKRMRYKILVADKPVNDIISMLLQTKGWEADTADTLHAALESVKRRDYDLILAGVNSMGGTDLVRKVKEISPELPIVAMTGGADQEHYTTFDELGVPVVMKPFRNGDLADIVTRYARQISQRI
jgi:DNA-binding response OmpR family regulator